MIKDVAVADKMVPTVPLLRVTTLPAAVGSKFAPEITSVVEVTSRFAVFKVTTGGAGGGGGGGGGGGAPPPPRTSPRGGVCGTPVAGSIGSEASAAAATVMFLAERPAATVDRGAHSTPSLVTT